MKAGWLLVIQVVIMHVVMETSTEIGKYSLTMYTVKNVNLRCVTAYVYMFRLEWHINAKKRYVVTLIHCSYVTLNCCLMPQACRCLLLDRPYVISPVLIQS